MASEEFVPGAICLVKSLKKHTSYPLNLLDLGLTTTSIAKLESLGVICHQVQRLGSKQARSRPWHCTSDFANNCFNKLHLWDSSYDKVIYLDADCLVTKCIDHLFALPCDFAAGSSFVMKYSANNLVDAVYSQEKFQAGVLVIRPDKDVFVDLMKLKDQVYCPEDPSDQGFLNYYYRTKWYRLDPSYNATRRVYMAARPLWDKMKDNIHVIHFTLEEPWLKSVPGCEAIEKLWWECYQS